MLNGHFAWRELSTSTPEAAKAFYTALLGWTAVDMPMPEIGTYTFFRMGDREVAGMMKAADGAPVMWNGCAFVDDVDAATTRAKKAGGTVVVEPMDIPEIGRTSAICDPQGAVIWPFKPGMETPEPSDPTEWEPRNHEFGWAELLSSNVAAMQTFYAAVMGWQFRRAELPGGDWYIEIVAKPRSRAGIGPAPKGGHPAWTHYLQMESAEATARRVVELGGSIRQPVKSVPSVGKLAIAADPQGAEFGIWSAS